MPDLTLKSPHRKRDFQGEKVLHFCRHRGGAIRAWIESTILLLDGLFLYPGEVIARVEAD